MKSLKIIQWIFIKPLVHKEGLAVSKQMELIYFQQEFTITGIVSPVRMLLNICMAETFVTVNDLYLCTYKDKILKKNVCEKPCQKLSDLDSYIDNNSSCSRYVWFTAAPPFQLQENSHLNLTAIHLNCDSIFNHQRGCYWWSKMTTNKCFCTIFQLKMW